MGAAGGQLDINPEDFDYALTRLRTLHDHTSSCQDTAAGHRNWADEVVAAIGRDIRDIENVIGGLRWAVDGAYNEVSDLLRELEGIAPELGGPMAGAFRGHTQGVWQELRNAIGHYDSARWYLDHPGNLLVSPWSLPGALGDAIGSLANAIEHNEAARAWLQRVQAQWDALHDEVVREIVQIATDVGGIAQGIAPVYQDFSAFMSGAKYIARGVSDAPSLLSELESFEVAALSALNNPIQAGLMAVRNDLALADAGLFTSGRVGFAALIPLMVALPMRGFQGIYWFGSQIEGGTHTALGRTYSSISDAWRKAAVDAETVGNGVNDVVQAFVDAHGMRILPAVGLGLMGLAAFAAVTAATGGLDLVVISVGAGAAESSIVLAPTVAASLLPAAGFAVGLSDGMRLDALMANPANVSADLSAAHKDFGQAPAMLHDFVNAATKTVTAPGPLNPIYLTPIPHLSQEVNVASEFMKKVAH